MASTRLSREPQRTAVARGSAEVLAKGPAKRSGKGLARRSGKGLAKRSGKGPPKRLIAGPLPGASAGTAAAGWGVYILRCVDGTLYTGCTNDLQRRLRAHGNQQVKYTRCRLPVALAYFEAAADRSAALRREAAIKRLARRAKLALCGCAKLC